MTHNQVPDGYRGWFDPDSYREGGPTNLKAAVIGSFYCIKEMQSFVYILYSHSGDIFYTGSTRIPVNDRLERHLTKYYGYSKFTSRYKDWEIFFSVA